MIGLGGAGAPGGCEAGQSGSPASQVRGTPSGKVPISDGVIAAQTMIENGLEVLKAERAKWATKATDSAAMASAEFKKFCERQKTMAEQMAKHNKNVVAAHPQISKLMTEFKAHAKLGPLVTKLRTLMNQADVVSRVKDCTLLTPIKSKLMPSAKAAGPKPGGPTIGGARGRATAAAAAKAAKEAYSN